MESTLNPKTADPHRDDVVPLAPKDVAGAEDALAKLAEATHAAINLRPRLAGADFSAGPRIASPPLEAPSPTVDHDLVAGEPGSHDIDPRELRSRGGAGRRILRFLFAVALGAAMTLAWQSYGEEARHMLAIYFPALAPSSFDVATWPGTTLPLPVSLDEPTATVQTNAAASAQSAAPVQVAAAAAATPGPIAPPSPELTQQIEAMARDLAAMRQRMEQLAVSNDQTARSIAKLQAAEEAWHKPPPPRPAVARAPQASLPLPRPGQPQSMPVTPPPPQAVSQSSATPPALPPPQSISRSSATPSPQPPRPPGALP